MVVSLADYPNFDKLFPQEGGEILWFENVAKYYGKTKDKLIELKNEGLAKITDIKTVEINENQNLAREHCVEILTTLIMKKNQARIDVFA